MRSLQALRVRRENRNHAISYPIGDEKWSSTNGVVKETRTSDAFVRVKCNRFCSVWYANPLYKRVCNYVSYHRKEGSNRNKVPSKGYPYGVMKILLWRHEDTLMSSLISYFYFFIASTTFD